MTTQHNLDIQFKDIKDLYKVIPNSSLEYLHSPVDAKENHYTIKGCVDGAVTNSLIFKAASMAGGVQHIRNTKNSVAISWICRSHKDGNEDIQECVNKFIWLLYWLEKNDNQFRKYELSKANTKKELELFRSTLKPLGDEDKEYMEKFNPSPFI